MVKCYRRAVKLSDLWVSENEKLSDFYASSWQPGESPIPLLILRLVLAVAALAILAWAVSEAPSPYWLVFLTNWGLVLVTVTLLSGVLVSSIAVFATPTDSDTLPWHVSMYWLFFNISIPTALLITALYWILIYDADPEEEMDPRMFWLDVATHGINSCIAVCELVASRTPVRALHVYQPLGLGLWYAGFTAAYYVAGGTDGMGNPFIYEILDWRHGRRSAVIVVVSVVALLILYSVVWGVAQCRDKLSTSFIRTIGHELPLTPPDQHMPKQIV